MPEPSASFDQLSARIAEHGVRSIDLQFTDVVGMVKSVTIAAGQLGEALEHGTWFDGSSVDGFARTAESDMYLVPDPTTFALLPWTGDPPTARLICWVHTPDGESYPSDPRAVLARAVDHAAAAGLEYLVGPEVEFFLLRREAEGPPRPPQHDGGGYFDFGTDASVGVRRSMVAALEALGVEVDTAHHEVEAGQQEFDLAHTPALRAADDLVTLRVTLRAVAQQAGLVASFMPKPFRGLNGSGMHVHQSLSRSHVNAFARAGDEYGLSEVAKHFIAGQLHHAAGMCLVLAPLVNSYKRLVRGHEAPVFVSWARTNRGALIRVPQVGREQATRVELRSPDPSCNPYLAYAVMLRCGLDGIERRLPLPPPVEESLYGFDDVELERRNVGVLPDNLKDAIEAFRHDEVVRAALGEHLVDRFLEAKLLEWRDYRLEVSPWELRHYLDR